ncbi:TMEM43 family protein [Coraliomargarita algicola]|uniref:TMEM43 family protein n=1 Tax=Coraliomargarita algicola TaxID=3092156 RepID=A0ABZ0RQ72_9BACT|nr:TMEM43 family protein [Coraliomargarita sp. J2-16]WPJ97389.1 TMEM43 family protein [Coraliomargarita sp. J2-16]
MAADSFSEISSNSWFSRIASSFKGILTGILLIIVSIVLLSWNEGRAVKRYKTLKEGAGAVVSIDSAQVDPSREGQLVHTSGTAVTTDTPSDSEFGISTHALKLTRQVEMYQWKESKSKDTQKKLGGSTETVTTYKYTKEWNTRPVRSDNFQELEGHRNPAEMRFTNSSFKASPVTVGGFTLTPSQVDMIGGAQALPFPSDYKVPSHIGESHLSPTELYIGKDPANPAIGDLKVSFAMVPEQSISLVAAQVQDSFQPYRTKVGGTINLLQSGTYSADAMIQVAQDNNKIMTWALRAGGLLLMFIGFNLLMGPLSVLADVVPFIGNIVGIGTAIVAMMLTAIAGLITIAVAWIVFRPVLAISLLLISGGVIYMIFKQAKSAKA